MPCQKGFVSVLGRESICAHRGWACLECEDDHTWVSKRGLERD